MRRILVFVVAVAVASPAHAFLGFGDITYDPQSYSQLSMIFQQTKDMYQTAKAQLDSLAQIQQTITNAQTAYETLGSMNMRSVTQGLTGNTNNIQSAAQLRAALANTEAGVSRSAGYLQFQLNQIDQLDNLATLQKAQAANAGQAATGAPNAATSAAITAQAAAATAALAAAAEQRRVQEDVARTAAAQAQVDNLNNSTKVYDAIGQ